MQVMQPYAICEMILVYVATTIVGVYLLYITFKVFETRPVVYYATRILDTILPPSPMKIQSKEMLPTYPTKEACYNCNIDNDSKYDVAMAVAEMLWKMQLLWSTFSDFAKKVRKVYILYLRQPCSV